MKNLTRTLQIILDANKKSYTSAQFAASAGINSGDLSRLRSGTKALTTEAFQKIIGCPLLTRTEAQQLIVAHLRDLTPAAYEDAIRISIAENSGALGENSDLLTEALEYYRHRARHEPEFELWFTGLYKTMTGK